MKIILLASVPLLVQSQVDKGDTSTLLSLSSNLKAQLALENGVGHLLDAVGTRNVTAMSSLVQSLVEDTISDAGPYELDGDVEAALQMIKDALLGDIRGALNEAHCNDQVELHKQILCFEGCEERKKVGAASCVAYCDGSAHKECRDGLLDKYKKHIDECRALDDFMKDFEAECPKAEKKCCLLSHTTWNCGSLCATAITGLDVDGYFGQWLTQQVEMFQSQYTEWMRLHEQCTAAYHAYVEEDAKCDCMQAECETTNCRYETCHFLNCEDNYNKCWRDCEVDFERTNEAKECLERDRKIDWSATEKIECYVDVLLAKPSKDELLELCGTEDCHNKWREEQYKACNTICPEVDFDTLWGEHDRREGDQDVTAEGIREVRTQHRAEDGSDATVRCTAHLDLDYQVPPCCSPCEERPQPPCTGGGNNNNVVNVDNALVIDTKSSMLAAGWKWEGCTTNHHGGSSLKNGIWCHSQAQMHLQLPLSGGPAECTATWQNAYGNKGGDGFVRLMKNGQQLGEARANEEKTVTFTYAEGDQIEFWEGFAIIKVKDNWLQCSSTKNDGYMWLHYGQFGHFDTSDIADFSADTCHQGEHTYSYAYNLCECVDCPPLPKVPDAVCTAANACTAEYDYRQHDIKIASCAPAPPPMDLPPTNCPIPEHSKACHFWGDPHFSHLFFSSMKMSDDKKGGRHHGHHIVEFLPFGVFNLASNADASFEAQAFFCPWRNNAARAPGVGAGLAMRFGDDIIQVVRGREGQSENGLHSGGWSDKVTEFFINGKQVSWNELGNATGLRGRNVPEFPGGLTTASMFMSQEKTTNQNPYLPVCVGNGQDTLVEVGVQSMYYQDVTIRTNQPGTDGICSVEGGQMAKKNLQVHEKYRVDNKHNLFSTRQMQHLCHVCHLEVDPNKAGATCGAPGHDVSAEEICQDVGADVEAAKAACAKEFDADDEWFSVCVMETCVSGEDAPAIAKIEEHLQARMVEEEEE